MDENVGRLLKAVDANRLARDTIVAFTSDHGHMLGSQGRDEIDLPYEEASNIPLLIRYPRLLRAGMIVNTPISNVDYAPTLLSLCGVQPPPEMQGANLNNLFTRGVSQPARPVFFEGYLGQRDAWQIVIQNQRKLVVDSSLRPTHLFDLGHDPYEMTNLFEQSSYKSDREKLEQLLEKWVVNIRNHAG